ncbi:peptide ABC transporter substrate-binding protein [Sciscionella marina]|uniref:peptide ABC transporter substrate-binding protein n=1 Tax=Sciscionella marina TaxID=508770 RepID=UPI0003803B12|nr:peptide ABC transporter substrate-binding protein [Sciscionella marina]
MVAGGSVSFALPPSATPNWILPIGVSGYGATYNSAIRNTLYPPLYLFDKTSNGTLGMDEKASAAQPPVYSPDGRTVSITLRNLTWSDGKPVTARDVEFFYNLVKAGKKQWSIYSEGRIPDNVTGFETTGQRSFRLHLDKKYNQDWFTANQLSRLIPMPQAVWDKTSDNGPVGDFDRNPKTAEKVFDYLVGQGKQLGKFSTNPLFKVVDGPFAIQDFSTRGQVTLRRNPHYTGPDPAHLDTVRFQTFTSSAAEYNVLLAGGVDYGYVPTSDLGQRAKLEGLGYRITPWDGWAVSYIPYNFNNPALGTVFKQRYVREAIQRSVNQDGIADVIWRQAATKTYGPVPQGTASKYLSPRQQRNPYPFDPARAKRQLAQHGWRTGSDGVAYCADPHACGPGIQKGTRLSMTVLSESGSDETTGMIQELKSSLSRIGVDLEISQRPLNSVLAATAQCKPADPSCGWQLSFFGTQGSWYYDADPSGERLFGTNGTSNLGSYSNPHADELIAETNESDDQFAMREYSAFLAEDLPVIWVPNPAYQVSAIDSALHGVTQDPLADLYPQRWYWTR